jgi:hypothetical protein
VDVGPAAASPCESSTPSAVGEDARTSSTSEHAERSHADACVVLAKQASEQAGPARLVLVRRRSIATEFTDARLRDEQQRA